MKKLILSILLCIAVLNPIQAMAKECYVCAKWEAGKIILDLKKLGWKVTDVQALDNQSNGYVKLFYEKQISSQ